MIKCISCEFEINPKWRHAIEMNICPTCGKSIMDEHLKNLFVSLSVTMEKLQQYPDQLNDWMLSNYNFIKTDSSLLPTYCPKEASKLDDESFQKRKNKKSIVKVKTESGEEEVETESLQSEERTNLFFKRAEAVQKSKEFANAAEKTEYLKKIAQQIKKSGGTQRPSDDGENEMIYDGNSEEVTIEEMQSVLEGGETYSSLPDIGDDEKIPSHILNMSKMAKGKGNKNQDMEDLQKLKDRADGINRPTVPAEFFQGLK